MKLFDLKPGTEFEYVDQEPFYRRGKFLVLNICLHQLTERVVSLFSVM
ncbi:hypothetical protein LCGC14_0653300 [marine sediment metagenome]|uniref:Uncharacterized protein n=1 Tax=marine sediment metagenome TaxID=412755 RepID=A0A0F9U429_9ZZZZ